jgi:hypothetical protein
MNNREHAFLWLALAVALLLSISGFWLRTGNERVNKTVVPVADYYLFEKSAQTSSLSMDQVLTDLKASGVKTIAVKETTLRGLAARGRLISPLLLIFAMLLVHTSLMSGQLSANSPILPKLVLPIWSLPSNQLKQPIF